jgi:hypothetical protein
MIEVARGSPWLNSRRTAWQVTGTQQERNEWDTGRALWGLGSRRRRPSLPTTPAVERQRRWMRRGLRDRATLLQRSLYQSVQQSRQLRWVRHQVRIGDLLRGIVQADSMYGRGRLLGGPNLLRRLLLHGRTNLLPRPGARRVAVSGLLHANRRAVHVCSGLLSIVRERPQPQTRH